LHLLLRRFNRIRVLASVVTLLAVLTHGLVTAHNAGAMTVAPSSYGQSGLDPILAADLQIICHSGGLQSPDSGKPSKEQRGSCPLCQNICKNVLAPPSSGGAIHAPLLSAAHIEGRLIAAADLRWPQRPPPGRGPPLSS
jgi:hypothetical protein